MNYDEKTRRLTASEGKVIKNETTGETYGNFIYLGIVDCQDNYTEVDAPEGSSNNFLNKTPWKDN